MKKINMWSSCPGNCFSTRTVPFNFISSEQLDWEARISFDNGSTSFSSGMISPDANFECLIVDVY